MKEYTVIYNETNRISTSVYVLTRMRRIVLQNHETLWQALTREHIEETAVFIFEGHPKLEGE